MSGSDLGRVGGNLPLPRVSQLPTRPGTHADDPLRRATQEFEAILWETVLKNLRQGVKGLSGGQQGQETEIYWGWFESALATQVAAGGSGVGELLYRQLQSQLAGQGSGAGTGAAFVEGEANASLGERGDRALGRQGDHGDHPAPVPDALGGSHGGVGTGTARGGHQTGDV